VFIFASNRLPVLIPQAFDFKYPAAPLVELPLLAAYSHLSYTFIKFRSTIMGPIISHGTTYRAISRATARAVPSGDPPTRDERVQQIILNALNSADGEVVSCWESAENLLLTGYARLIWIRNPKVLSCKLMESLLETGHEDIAKELLPHCDSQLWEKLLQHLISNNLWGALVRLGSRHPNPEHLERCLARTRFCFTDESIEALWRLDMLSALLAPWVHYAPHPPKELLRLNRWDALAEKHQSSSGKHKVSPQYIECCQAAQPDLPLLVTALRNGKTLLELLAQERFVPIIERFMSQNAENISAISRVFSSCLNNNNTTGALILRAYGAQYLPEEKNGMALRTAIQIGDEQLVQDCLMYQDIPEQLESSLLSIAIITGNTQIVKLLFDAGVTPNRQSQPGTSIIAEICSVMHLHPLEKEQMMHLILSHPHMEFDAPQIANTAFALARHFLPLIPPTRRANLWTAFINAAYRSSDNKQDCFLGTENLGKHLLPMLMPPLVQMEDWRTVIDSLPPSVCDDSSKVRAIFELATILVNNRGVNVAQLPSLADMFAFLLPQAPEHCTSLFCPTRGRSIWSCLSQIRNTGWVEALFEAGFPMVWEEARASDYAIRSHAWDAAEKLLTIASPPRPTSLSRTLDLIADTIEMAYQQSASDQARSLAGAARCANLLIDSLDAICGENNLHPRILMLWSAISEDYKSDRALSFLQHPEACWCNPRCESLAATILLMAPTYSLEPVVLQWLQHNRQIWQETCPYKGLQLMQQVLQKAYIDRSQGYVSQSWLEQLSTVWQQAADRTDIELMLASPIRGLEPLKMAAAVSAEWAMFLEQMLQ